jgi:hypothetical protein
MACQVVDGDFCILYSHEPMTVPGDFADLFDGCRTHREANEAYTEGIQILAEALRLAHMRIVAVRDAPIATVTVRTPEQKSEGALKASHDTAVRQWATTQGIPFRRVGKKLRKMYEEAHGNG